MKLRNKKTRNVLAVESISLVVPTLVADKKIIQLTGTDAETGYRKMYRYKSLAELAEEWEDYEEPKKHYWVIDDDGVLVCRTVGDFTNEGMCKQIGNYFESKEEAEKAVGRLYAWKRLKDKGFRFTGYTSKDRGTITEFEIYCDTGKPCIDRDEFTDLDLLFCPEENS